MAVAVCPKPETLAAFARGDLSTAELTGVAEHLGGCEACCRALKVIPEDSLAGLARAAVAVPHTVYSVNIPSPLVPGAAKTSGPAAFANHPRYRILGELGAGGMGTVYKAHDELMERVVALKVVSPHLTAKASALARFHKEVRAAAKLEHVNIVRAYDAGEAGGSQFLVMEFVEGISLDRLVAKKGPLPVPMACTFIRQTALGLQHAAEKGMTHRDIKPQNLVVTRKGQVRILDFGLARFARTDEEEATPTVKLPFGAGKAVQNAGVTNPNLLMGTPDYLSPEQAKNSHDVDPRSDIYSLGCTLYFLLTGKPPFVSASTLIDKLLAHTNDEPPSIREQRFEVTEGLAEVLAKMMAKKPEDRYQTAKEAADALHPFTRADAAKDDAKEPVFEIVEAVVVSPVPIGVALAPRDELAFDTEPVPGAPTLAESPRPRKSKKAKKRQPWWQRRKWALLGAAALFLIVAGVIAALGGKKPTDTGEKPGEKPGEIVKNNPPQGSGKNKGTPGSGNTVIASTPDHLVVLYVIPSQGVWAPDYDNVRPYLVASRPEKKRVLVETAATYNFGKRAPYAAGSKPLGSADGVPVDTKLAVDMNLSKYSAVVFCGFNVDEYINDNGGGKQAAGYVIQKMRGARKPIAAICAGQTVLATHGVLDHKKAAYPPAVENIPKYRWMLDGTPIMWQKGPMSAVIVDDNIITAAGPPEAQAFADAILKAIDP